MSNALQRVAREMKPELDLYGIRVYGASRRIGWKGVSREIDFGTDKRQVKKIIKGFIRAAQRDRGGQQLELL